MSISGNCQQIWRFTIYKLLAYPVRVVKIFCTMDLPWPRFSARRVPCLLIPDQKRTSLITSWVNQTLFVTDPAGFLTQDEFWVHHFEREKMETPLLQRRLLSLHLHWRWWTQVLGSRQALCLLTLFKWVTTQMESTTSCFWGSYEELQYKYPGKLMNVLFHQDHSTAHNFLLSIAVASDWLYTDWSRSLFSCFFFWLSSLPQQEKRTSPGISIVVMISYLVKLSFFN